MASIFDVFGRLLLDDDKKFQAQAKASAEKAGDTAGTTMGQRMSAKMGTALKVGLVGVGAAGGALFGVAAKGGAELTASVAAFRAETGATAEEAELAQDSIANLYANNINGFEELGEVLASVKTNLALSGEEGEAAAQRMLDYAKVTGQDAVGATEAFDDLLDSLNLTYEEGSGLLDQLVESHQKYGGSVEGNQAALAKLGPALNAANLGVEDGVGLLNLFAASGLDAADAPAALTKALAKVESPEELQALIDDISATKDPFDRAALASELFGTKAGPKLANALDGVSFTDFTVGVDEATGAIEEASEVMDNEPFTALKLKLKELAGPLAEAGTSFGPLVLGFSQLGGGKLIASAGTGIGAFAGKVLPLLTTSLLGLLPALAGTLATIGTGIGSAIAAAVPIGMALLPVILVAALIAAIIFLINNPEIVGKIIEFAKGIVETIAKVLGEIVGFFAKIFGRAVELVGIAIGNIVSTILSLPGRAVGFVAKLVAQFFGVYIKGAQAIGKLVSDVVTFFLSIPGKVASWVGSIVGQVGQLASSVISKVTSLVGSIVRFFLSIPGRIASLGGRIVSGIINGLASLPGRLADVIRNAFRNLRIDIGPFHISSSGVTIDLPNIQLPSFATGGRPDPGVPALIGEEGPELWVPDTAGTILPAGAFSRVTRVPAEAQGAGGGWRDFVVHGALPVRTIRDVSLEMQRIDGQGRTPSRLLSPAYLRREAEPA